MILWEIDVATAGLYQTPTRQTLADGSGVGNSCDNCLHAFNIDRTDSNDDGLGDVCDNCLATTNMD
jgi:hypothetical protein